MTKHEEAELEGLSRLELSDADILEAMKRIPGYLDITPGDFKEVYALAFKHAVERLTRAVKAADIMTREVLAVKRDTPLTEVAAAMGGRGVSGVPVLEADGRVAGMISEKDFLVRLGGKAPKNFMSVVAECLEVSRCVAQPLRHQSAQDIMSAPAIAVSPETTAAEIAQLLVARAINRVAVTDERGMLVGLVSRADLVKAHLIGVAS